MLAIGMVRGKQGVSAFEVPEPQLSKPDEVLVRVKEVGVNGTDFNIARCGCPETGIWWPPSNA